MNEIVGLLLLQDGIVNGAVYALLGLSLVMVFSVTRIIFVPQGELVSFGALTLAALQAGQWPGTIWVSSLGAGVVSLVDLWRYTQTGRDPGLLRSAIGYAIVAIGVAALWWLDLRQMTQWQQLIVALVIVSPISVIIYRLAFEPIANASVLTLLVVAVAVHFALLGLGLILFGPEGVRTAALTTLSIQVGPYTIVGQAVLVGFVASSLMMMMFIYFEYTIQGKALRATAFNRVGARLVGIEVTAAGRIAFLFTGIIGAVSGILISPITTIYYDTGFLIGLKGFVAAIFGGMLSYPLTVVGALFIGIFETFSSFWASAFKDVIVFALIIPVLLWRNVFSQIVEEDEGE